MALIKCPECGNMISDKAAHCPRCGCPVGNAGVQQDASDARARYEDNDRTRIIYEKRSNTNKWLYAAIALLALALLGGGTYFFMNKNKGNDTSVENYTEDVPATTTVDIEKDSPAPAPIEQQVPTTTPAPATKETPATTSSPVEREEPATVVTPVQRNKVSNGFYRLNGSITYKETYFVDMEVNVNGNKATGRYIVHNGENMYVNLSGSIDANGNMKLTEYKGGQPTGYYFTGKFNQVTYSGKYLCTYKNLPMRFSVSTY